MTAVDHQRELVVRLQVRVGEAEQLMHRAATEIGSDAERRYQFAKGRYDDLRLTAARQRGVLRRMESEVCVVQCPICGDEYVLPQDGDPSRRCPTCASPAVTS